MAAVPLRRYRSIPVEPPAGNVVLDADNYCPERDGQIPEPDRRETTTSEMLARHLPP